MNVSRETLLPEVRFAQMLHVKHLKRRDLNVSRETIDNGLTSVCFAS